MKLDWERLNHVLIPVPTAARQRTAKPLPKAVVRFVDLAFSLTAKGQVVLVGSLLLGALSIALPASRVPYLFGLLFGLFAVSIALRRMFRLDVGASPTRAALEQPTRVTVGEPLAVRVVVTTDEPPHTLSVRGPFLPYFARYEGKPEQLVAARGQRGLTATFTVRFSRRQDLFLGPFAVQKKLPFELVGGPSVTTGPFRITIVPKPARVRLTGGSAAGDGTSGRAARRGGLRDLAGVREYRAGDRVRDLDARAWARTGLPHVREYDDPEVTRVVLLFDTQGVEGDTFEAAVSLAAGVAEAILAAGPALDVFVVGDTLYRLDAGRGKGALAPVLDALSVAEPTTGFDARVLLARVTPHLANVSAVVLVTTRWDDARAELCQTLIRRGLGTKAAVVHGTSAGTTLPSYARAVAARAVREGTVDL